MKIALKNWYRILAPRPVVLISTVSADGTSNLAPFSFVAPVSIEPPLIAFASDPGHDTVRNITRTKNFVVNIPGKDILGKLWACAGDFPYGVSEFKKAKLHEMPSRVVRAPRVKECFAHIECTLHSARRVGDHMLVVGAIRAVEIKDALYKKGSYQIAKSNVLMHIGSEKFGMLGKTICAS